MQVGQNEKLHKRLEELLKIDEEIKGAEDTETGKELELEHRRLKNILSKLEQEAESTSGTPNGAEGTVTVGDDDYRCSWPCSSVLVIWFCSHGSTTLVSGPAYGFSIEWQAGVRGGRRG